MPTPPRPLDTPTILVTHRPRDGQRHAQSSPQPVLRMCRPGLALLAAFAPILLSCTLNVDRQGDAAKPVVPRASLGADPLPDGKAEPEVAGTNQPQPKPSAAAGIERPHAAAPAVQLERIADALSRIKSEYVDPVEYEQLVSGCRKSMRGVAHGASIPALSAPSGGRDWALQEIGDAFSAIQEEGTSQVTDPELTEACIRGMLETLDGRSLFVDRADFREMQVGSTPLAGIGLELKIEADRVVVVAPIEGAPGARAGLTGGDAIEQIDDEPLAGLSLKDVVKRLRGPSGSEVKLTVARPDVEQPLVFVLTREAIVIESVRWASLSPGVGYFKVSQFNANTGQKLGSAITSAYARNQGALNGLILDLRNNPGGLLNACVAVSAAFLPKNALIVSTAGRSPDSKMRLYASTEYYLRGNSEDYFKQIPASVKTLPMVVLVNHTSASCSEIVAAAMQDHKRATIVGRPTFGLGIVQTIIPLKGDTALKLTTARYYRPNGKPMGAEGVTPDVAFDHGPDGSPYAPSPRPEDDLAVGRALAILHDKSNPGKK
jgi:carboxyl-terminal processing protease